ncbi:MAG: hypothetical protein U1A77_04960 [Pirellulales bacterium]
MPSTFPRARTSLVRTLAAAPCLWLVFLLVTSSPADAAPLRAGAAKIDVTKREAGPARDPLWVKALVVSDGATTAVLITVDAVAIGEIGPIRNDYLSKVREQLTKEHGIQPTHVAVNASHCHGIVCDDIDVKTVAAVKAAIEAQVPVKVGVGVGHENRIMENRRMRLKDGREADVRHAYSLPPDETVADIGPIDPQIGVLRLDRLDGRTLAVVYNFACHPIQGVPGGGNTADLTGYASKAIEESLGDNAIALFVQGCGGDINPVFYKDVDHPRDAEPLGNMLGLSTLRAVKRVACGDSTQLRVVHELLELPRADLAERIVSLQAEQNRLLQSLRGTSLNFKTFLPLVVKYQVAGEFPSYYAHRYLHDRQNGREDLKHLDEENRRNMEAYLKNIHTMEELTRVQTNLALLKKHHQQNMDAGKRTLNVELVGIRIGDFVMITFPGELTVQIGLNLKKVSPHPHTFIAGYTNGYIYYAPTTEQLKNAGNAQEDSDCILAPHWQAIFEKKALEILRKL